VREQRKDRVAAVGNEKVREEERVKNRHYASQSIRKRKRDPNEPAPKKEPGKYRRIDAKQKFYEDFVRKRFRRAILVYCRECGTTKVFSDFIIQLLDVILIEASKDARFQAQAPLKYLKEGKPHYIQEEYFRAMAKCVKRISTKDYEIRPQYLPSETIRKEKMNSRVKMELKTGSRLEKQVPFVEYIVSLVNQEIAHGLPDTGPDYEFQERVDFA
jgi:hypothetical protein